MNTVQSSRNSKNVRMLGSAYLCASVLLTCESLSGGQGYFHREDAKSAKKSDFKNFAFFASSRWIFWVAAGLHCVHLWFRSFFWVAAMLHCVIRGLAFWG